MELDSLFKLVSPEPNSGCWLWTLSCKPSGYGQVNIYGGEKKLLRYAHRLAYESSKGPIPKGMDVMHECDNRLCINPSHLSLGTRADNMQDAKRKGRLKVWERQGLKCKNGHNILEGGVRNEAGERRCAECRRQANRDYRKRIKLRVA